MKTRLLELALILELNLLENKALENKARQFAESLWGSTILHRLYYFSHH